MISSSSSSSSSSLITQIPNTKLTTRKLKGNRAKIISKSYIIIAILILLILMTILLLHSHQKQEIGLGSRIVSLKGKANEILSSLQDKQKHLNEVLKQRGDTNPIDDDYTKIKKEETDIQKNDIQNKNNNNNNFGGGDKHPILLLNDDEYQSISLKKMMSWYDTDPSGTCDNDFGNKLVERWTNTRKPYCASSSLPSLPSLSSSIDCFLVSQTRHAGNGDNLCLMKNVAVNLGYFGNDMAMNSVVENYVHTHHNQQPYVKFQKGFIKAEGCTIDSNLWQSKYMPGWNADLTTECVEIVNTLPTCDEWINEPVMIMQRDTFANFFHDSEDFFDVFLGMAILDWSKMNTQFFLTDLYPRGPFWDLWSKVFSSNNKDRKTMTSWDLKLKYGNNINKHVCFKQLAIGIYGPAAPITVASWNTPCHSTALVKAYSDYVIRGLGLQHLTHYKQSKPLKTIVITYLARRSSSEWPEKKYCDSHNSFFKCELWESFGIRKLGRVIKNDNEVVEALKELEKESFNNGAIIKFQDVDFNLLSFEEQIKIDLQTDILIGPHGAGLMHNIFMRDRAILIELSIDGSSANRHFHNLANWYGRKYFDLMPSNPVNVGELKSRVRDAISQVNIDKY